MIHRIASSEQYSSSLHEIQTAWSLQDVMEANDVLDLLDLANAQAMKKTGRDR